LNSERQDCRAPLTILPPSTLKEGRLEWLAISNRTQQIQSKEVLEKEKMKSE
jgi:hypothetical protein